MTVAALGVGHHHFPAVPACPTYPLVKATALFLLFVILSGQSREQGLFCGAASALKHSFQPFSSFVV